VRSVQYCNIFHARPSPFEGRFFLDCHFLRELKMADSFAAIDFETADEKRDSACALSIVIVNNNRIDKHLSFLIKPPRQQFLFSYLHGIRWEDVVNKPTFSQLWPQISHYFENLDFIAAHNAPFDKSVLLTCCRRASIKPPEVPFVCTVKLAREIWNIYPTKLPHVCKKLGIPLDHHNAASDALACAKIVLAAQKKSISNFLASYCF
jgi:DNA polymerase-3 subunit epsilon